ncbi:MAG: hypothetical protein IJU31_04000 [Synergistaceae bacterium]|nr:hypothetical protein [Synergistaceae bacterium]
MQIEELLNELETIKRILEHKAEEIHQRELIKDLDERRKDWERRSALFVPSKQKLEKGGKTLELGEDYENIKELREAREKNKIRQSSLRDEMTKARAELRNSEEALSLFEGEYRDRLAAQTQLKTLVQRVKTLDEQIVDRQAAVVQLRKEHSEADSQYKECSELVEKERIELEKIELALREVRKFLRTHSIDEKLQTAIAGIQKCFSMFEAAEEKRISLKNSWNSSIAQRQHAQSSLNDRSTTLADFNHSLAVHEKVFVKARAFFESALKGKTISEWRGICDTNIKRLAELDELYKKFQRVQDLEDRVKNFQDIKTRIQHETRSINIRDVEQSGKLNELQREVEKLEKRSALLRRIEDIEAVRELLQDGIPCPLCGSLTHPYVSGAVIPDPEEVHKQLHDTQRSLDELRDELTVRQTRAGKLSEEITSVTKEELELKKQINELNAEISSRVSVLGMSFSQGISPFEEIDRARQKARDALQIARTTAETAEAAELEMKNAADELDKIREKREAAAHSHQEALFTLKNEKTQEEQIANELKTQEEAVTSLKRELISQIMPFGYKSIPDKEPVKIIEALETRMNEWIENAKRSETLEHELSSANSKMAMLKKNTEAFRLKREDLTSRVKATEAERDSVQQQRIILFASKNPESELSRMNTAVEELRAKLNERRENKNEQAAKLDKILSDIHGVETEIAKGREELQRYEISFNKKLLALGFRNEDDYAAACLAPDERRELQSRLRELTQEDMELNADRENARAKLIELQSHGTNLSDNEIITKLTKSFDEIRASGFNSPELTETTGEINRLLLSCGLPEI